MNKLSKIGRDPFVTALLASASALVVGGVAQAADLPSRKAEPVQYVKICDAYGKGFFTLPGSDTCLKIGGYVRFETQYTPGQRIVNVGAAGTAASPVISQVAGAQDTTGMEARGRVILDARTPTAMGPVRTYVRISDKVASGIRNTGGATNFQTTYPVNVATGNSLKLERAYIEWNGFTFGNWGSEYAGLWPSGAFVGSGDFAAGWTNGVKGIAYTAKFGGGWTAAVQIDDRTDAGPANNSAATTGLLAPVNANQQYNHTPLNGYNLVGVLRYEQAWGGAEINGMVGNNSTSDGPLLQANTGSANPLLGSKTYSAWAVNSTVQINLPMIAAGDALFLNAGYGKGALGYAGAPDAWNTLVSDSTNRRVLGGVLVAPSNLQVTSMTPGGAPLSYGQTTAFVVEGIFSHYWSAQWRTHLGASYMKLGTPTAINPVGGFNTQLGNSSVWDVKANLIYSPVKDFDIGVEGIYGRINTSIQNVNPATAFALAGQPGLKEGNWTSRFRVQRGF